MVLHLVVDAQHFHWLDGFHLVRYCEVVFLNHGIILSSLHFSCGVWSFRLLVLLSWPVHFIFFNNEPHH